jgi:hypothetical protein
MNWSTAILKRSGKQKSQQVLPYSTISLCPECLKKIAARIYEEDGQVFMEKTCPEHGECKELISSDAKFYKLMFQRDKAGINPVTNPITGQAACPNGCGLCDNHLSSPIMINIDLTNRCNLRCPICFANSDARGEVVEWDMDQVRWMLDHIREMNDVQPACLQYTGGEPTVHPNFLQALEEGKRRDYTQIQAASNGLKFAKSKEFCHQASEAGLNIVYLQFDGLDDEIYKQVRGRPLIDVKKAAINNLYEAGIRSVLVPTLVKGVNDKEIGAITNFALDNIDKITAVSWQPVAFTGRIDYEKRMAQRFTMADLAREVQQQTGIMDMYRDWYPFSFGDPFARFVEAISGEPGQRMTCNPGCGGTGYLIVDRDTKETVSIPEFVDVDPLMEELEQLADKAENGGMLRRFAMSRQLKKLKKYYHPESAPKGWTFDNFVQFLTDFAEFGERYSDNESRRKSMEKMPYRTLMMASMHFQDAYNYQLDRVERCVIHYAAPNGRVYPFCTYNSGPCHRYPVEKEYAVPVS